MFKLADGNKVVIYKAPGLSLARGLRLLLLRLLLAPGLRLARGLRLLCKKWRSFKKMIATVP